MSSREKTQRGHGKTDNEGLAATNDAQPCSPNHRRRLKSRAALHINSAVGRSVDAISCGVRWLATALSDSAP